MVRVILAAPEGYSNEELELELHEGAGRNASDSGGPYIRVELGQRDAGAVISFLHKLHGADVATAVEAARCSGCEELATVHLQAVEDPDPRPWCWRCAPPAPDQDADADAELPHRRTVTEAGLRYLLRTAYGLIRAEQDRAIREHPYSIAAAASNGWTVEELAGDIARRLRQRERAKLTAQTDRLDEELARARGQAMQRAAARREAVIQRAAARREALTRVRPLVDSEERSDG